MLVMFDPNICRLCARATSEPLVPIFDVDHTIKDRIDLKIKKCFPSLIINEDDSKPKHICMSCMTKLNVCDDLFDLCFASDSKFNTVLTEQCTIQGREEIVETCLIKQSSSCLWPPTTDGGKNEKTLTVHDGGVIVLSKVESETQHETDDRDFVVMVELKYKKPEEDVDADSVRMQRRTGDKLHSLVATYTDADTDVPLQLAKTSSADHGYVSAQIKSNHAIDEPSIVLFASNNVRSPKEKCLRLITNNCTPIKKTVCDKIQVNQHSKKRATDKKVFVCSVCGKQFQRRTRLNCHMALHTEMRPHACDQCDETFVMRWDLTLHQRIHQRTFQCEYCHKIFTVRSKLDRHIRTHTGERPHMCGYCCKSFGDKRNLDNHLRTHTGEKPFECDVCGRRFRVRTHLTDHHRVHTKETPFKCPTCAKTFRWKANYNTHLKTHIPPLK